MRIISGILKGKSIDFLKNSNTRPLKDSVRENIFNILKHSNLIKIDVENSSILDLYSGIGSFGIESLSRLAKKVTFVEQDEIACKILKTNLKKLFLIKKSIIFNNKVENILNDKILKKFDIFFLDQPFANLDYLRILKLIKNKKIFNLNHIVIIHREKKADDNFENLLKIVETKFYGRSKIIFGEFI